MRYVLKNTLEKVLIIKDENREDLLSDIIEKKPHIVGIDGEVGVGKSTTIAPLLRKLLGGIVLSLDSYLEKDNGGYIGHLRYDALRQYLLGLVQKSDPVIIEGIMLLDVLEKVGVNQDYLIYACSSMWLDDWTGEHGNYYHKTLEEIIKFEEDNASIVSPKIQSTKYQMQGARKEIYAYTYQQQPFFKANAILIS